MEEAEEEEEEEDGREGRGGGGGWKRGCQGSEVEGERGMEEESGGEGWRREECREEEVTWRAENWLLSLKKCQVDQFSTSVRVHKIFVHHTGDGNCQVKMQG